MEPLPLAFPTLGVNRELAGESQPPGTTPSAVNVRGIDPRSGRVRGARRSGLAAFSTSAIRTGFPVVDLGQVARNRPRFAYDVLTEEPQLDLTPSLLTAELTLEPPDLAVAGAMLCDRAGNLYAVETDAVSPSTRVLVWSPAGELVHAIPVPVGPGQNLVRGLGLTQDQYGKDNIFVAATNFDTNETRVVRLLKREEGVYDVAWSFQVPAGCYDLALDGELLYLATRHSEGFEAARVGLIGGLWEAEPFFAWQRGAPNPVRSIAVAADGSVLVSSEPNLERGAAPGYPGYFTPQELWSPHLITNADERLYFWLDVQPLDDLAPGQEIDIWRDRRWLHVLDDDAAPPPGALPSDGTNVFSNVSDAINRWALRQADFPRKAPTYNPGGIGIRSSLHFNAYADQPDGTALTNKGSVVRTPVNELSATAKTDTNGDGFPNAEGLMLGSRSALPSMQGISFTTFWVFKFSPAAKARVLASISAADGTMFGIVVNADRRTVYPTQTNAGVAGRVTVYANSVTGAAGGDEIAEADCSASGDYGNDKQLVILAFHHGGDFPGTNPDDLRSWLRVNGRAVDRFNLLEAGPRGGSSWTLIGAPYRTDTPDPSTDLFAQQQFAGATLEAFDGELVTVLTVLGDTSDEQAPHQVPTTYPNTGGGNGGTPPAAGATYQYSVDQATDEATTNAATETERIEGWLAHRMGAPDILESGNTPVPSGGLYANHPFGGSSHPPVGPTGLSATAASANQLALLSQDGVLAKFTPAGGYLAWAFSAGGVGAGAASDPDGWIVAIGPKRADTDADPIARRLRDYGSSYSLDVDGCWVVEDARDLYDYGAPPPQLDGRGDAYLPLEGWRATVEIGAPNNTAPTNGTYLDVESGDGSTAGGPVAGSPAAGFVRYEFWATPTAAYQVKIGATRHETALNLKLAMEQTGTEGVHYFAGTAAHPSVTLDRRFDTVGTFAFRAKGFGTAFNGLRYDLQTSGWLAGDTAFLAGGRAGQVRKYERQTGNLVYTYAFSGARVPIALAFPPKTVVAPEDEAVDGQNETIWISSVDIFGRVQDAPPIVEKVRQLAVTPLLDPEESPREVVVLGVAGGRVAVLREGQAPEIPEGGEGALESDAATVQSFELYGDRFFLDGRRYAVYRGRAGIVEAWEAEGEGEIPPNCQLGCAWNQRAVLARDPEAPWRLFMSERGNPDGWAAYPPVPGPTDAVVGDVRIETPGVVTSLLPGGDDVLYIGQDREIHVLVGDPGLGGAVDRLSSETGMAFGQTGAMDPDGVAYFVGSKGGVYAIIAGRTPEEISARSVRRALESYDWDTYEPRLVWNFRDRGLHVFVVPRGAGGEVLEHWFWEKHTGAWWPDKFSAVPIQPTAAASVDGDLAADRRVLVGTAGGLVAAWDPSAEDDVGYRVVAHVDFPLLPDQPRQFRFKHPAVILAGDQGGATVELLASETADAPDVAWRRTARHELQPGRNARAPLKVRAAYARLRIASAIPGRRWAFEGGDFMLESAGHRRPSRR